MLLWNMSTPGTLPLDIPKRQGVSALEPITLRWALDVWRKAFPRAAARGRHRRGFLRGHRREAIVN